MTSMLPYQAIPESTDVTATPPQSPQPTETPSMTATIPSETPPNNPDIERQYHENWLHHKLDQVGRVLGGGETITYTKDPDGNVTMTHTPSTTKEMWGRVAQAALVGAASGLQNSQGPGGLAKAAAAGVQTGAQLPQQRTQQAQQQVDFDNKQLLAKANRIHIAQESAMLAAQTRLNNLKVDEETANVLNASQKDYQGRPGAIDYGSYDPSDVEGESKITNQNPGAMDDFLGKNNRKTALVLEGDHKLHVIGYGSTDDERWNDKPVEVPYNDVDKDGNPIVKTKTAGPGSVKMGDLDLKRDAVQGEYLRRVGIKATADQHEADANKGSATKPLDTSGKTLDAWRTATPDQKPALWAQYQQQLQDEKSLKQKPEATGTWSLGEDGAGNSILFNSKTGHVMDAPDNIKKAGTKAKQDAAIAKATQPAKEAMEYANTYMNQGAQNTKAFTGPGDEALMDKYFELAKPSSGFRMTPGQQKMLIDSRGWMGSLEGRAYHQIHGTWFSPQQRQQIVNTMGNLAASKGITPGGGSPPPTPGGGTTPPQIPPGRYPVYVKGQLVGHSADKAGTDYQPLTAGGQ
jgi:hypothetical protein